MRWMNLEPITQSEVSQKEKNKYGILTHICGIEKDGIDEPICRAAMETHMENRLVGPGECGEDGTNRETDTETYTLPYVTMDCQWKLAL